MRDGSTAGRTLGEPGADTCEVCGKPATRKAYGMLIATRCSECERALLERLERIPQRVRCIRKTDVDSS